MRRTQKQKRVAMVVGGGTVDEGEVVVGEVEEGAVEGGEDVAVAAVVVAVVKRRCTRTDPDPNHITRMRVRTRPHTGGRRGSGQCGDERRGRGGS
eukprot:m.51152 g.51152  ORF g.51152 m.51152 type:complete len:95 (-) comp16402_c0_seq1:55-339(-)